MNNTQNNIKLNSCRWLVFNLKIEAHLRSTAVWKITKVALRVILLLSKSLNLLVGDHRWHSQSLGVEKIDLYRNNFEKHPSLREHEKDIIEIFNALENPGCTKQEFLDLVANGDTVRIKKLAGNTKLHFQVLANEFGKHSKMEGGHLENSVGLLSKFCSQHHPVILKKVYGIDEDLLNQIQQTIYLSDNLFGRASRAIQSAINSGKNALIAGGWTGSPHGHAMMFEVVPVDNETVNFRIYNLGAGASQHARRQEGGKIKANPCVEWRGVRKSALLNATTLEALIEMTSCSTIPHTDSLTQYGSNDIYKGLRKLLKPSEIGVIEGSMLYKTTQHSGVCSWRSFEAFLSTRIPREQYKKLVLDIKLSSILRLVSGSSGWFDSPYPEDLWGLVHKAKLKLARKVDQAFSQGYIGLNYLTETDQHLKSVEGWLKANAPVEPSSRSSKIINFRLQERLSDIKTWVMAKVAVKRQDSLEQVYLGNLPSASLPNDYLVCGRIMENIVTERPQEAIERLTRAADLAAQFWTSGHADTPLNIALNEYILKLPLDINYWKSVASTHPEGIAAISRQLRRLGSLAFKTAYMKGSQPAVHPHMVFSQTKLKGLFHLLGQIENPVYGKMSFSGCIKDENELSCYKLYREEYCRQSSLTDGSKYNSTFFYLSDSGRDGNYEINNSGLYKFLSENDPELCNKLNARLNQDGVDTKITDKEKSLHFLLSDALPDWMIGLRDTVIHENWLYQSPVPWIENLDRSRGLDCHYTMTNINDTVDLRVSLTGVDKIKLTGYNSRWRGDSFKYWQVNIAKSEMNTILKADRGFCVNEKKLLHSYHSREKIKLLTPEEQVEIRHLFSRAKIRPWKLLGYFSKYPSKLNEPEYQVLFKHLFFQDETYNLFDLAKSRFPGVLEDFLAKFLTSTYREGEISACVFLNQVAGILETYRPDSPVYSRTYERLAGLLHKPGLTSEERKQIYLGLIEYVYHQERPTEEQLSNVLKGVIELSGDETFLSKADPEMVKCRNDFAFKHFAAIQGFLGLPGALEQDKIHALLSDRVQRKRVWSTRATGFGIELFSLDGSYVYNPCTGVLEGVERSRSLPANITENPLFKSLFPNELQRVTVKNDVCKVLTAEGGEYYITLGQGASLSVQKKLPEEGAWARYCSLPFVFSPYPNSGEVYTRGSKLHGRYFEGHYQGWIESTSPNIVRFKEIGKPDSQYAPFQLDIRTGIVSDVELGIVLKPSSHLSRFEHPDFIHEWHGLPSICSSLFSSKPRVLELPRYNLAFTASPENPDLYESREFPGYYLQADGRVPALGIYQEYLLLENSEGHQKILLPQLDLSAGEFESLAPRYHFNLEGTSSENRRFFAYEIGEEGIPVGETLEARLWLAKIFALAQKHQRSAKILRGNGEKVTPYTARELDVLKKFETLEDFNGDKSGDGISIRLYALYLSAKNKQITEKLDEEELKKLDSVYRSYLSHLKNATALPLKRHEELYLCKLLLGTKAQLKSESRRIFQSRYDVLVSGTERCATVRSTNLDGKNSGGSIMPYLSKFETYQELANSAKKPYLITRAGSHILNHFAYFHSLAATGTGNDKARLEAACKFMSTTPGFQLMGEYLLYVMEHPEFYNQPIDRLKDTWSVVKERAESLKEQNLLLENAQIQHNYPKHKRTAVVSKPSNVEPVEFSFAVVKEPTVLDNVEGYFQLVTPVEGQKGVVETFKDWLLGVKQEQSNLSTLENQEYNRLIEDCNEVAAERKYGITNEVLTSLEERLSENREENRSRLAQLKRSILKKVHQRTGDPTLSALQSIRTKGGHKKIAFEEVLMSFARKSPEALVEKNRTLNEEHLHEIYSETAEYLQLVTWEQQRGRALREIKKIKRADGEKRQGLVQSLRTIICAQRVYSIAENPALLVFEFYSQKLLWDKQVRGLKLFLERKEENPVMELIMGSGKSEVLLPLLALLRADGTCISMIIAPQTLFENVSSNTQKINKEAFGQSLHTIHFERNTELTETKLQLMLQELHHIRDHKEALVVTSKTIQCIILKFMELAYKHYSGDITGKNPPETLKLLGEILQLLSSSGHPIVDEADSIMRIMHEVSFNLGDRITPNQHEIEFIRAVYETIIQHPDLKLKKGARGNENDEVLTADHYEEKWKPVLMNEIFRLFRGAKEGSFGLDRREADCLAGLSQIDLRNYLNRNTERSAQLDQWFSAIPEKKVRDIVSLAAEEVTHLLSFTMLKEWNVAYGRDHKQQSPIPVPFEFAAVPKSGSVFANPYITKNYAYQTYLKEGVDAEMVHSQIKRLQDQATTEMRKLGVNDYTLTKAWKEFCILKGDLDVPFLKLNKTQLNFIVQGINSSREHLLRYVANFVLPQLVLYSHKLTCSPINMISLFKLFSGFTGTLWNKRSMYHQATPLPEKGTEAKTLSILWKNCSDPDSVVMVNNRNSQELLLELREIPHDVLIDGGGYLKEMSNNGVAEKMTEFSGSPTVHYNTKGEKTLILDGVEIPLSESRLKMHQRRTYLDHSHTVGANVPQMLEAVGVITIGKGILLRDILQFVWRMRGLADLQRVKFIVSMEVAMLIRKALGLADHTPIRFVHILAYAIKNQADQQGADNHKSFVGQLWNVPQQLLLRVLFSEMLTEEQKKAAYDKLEKIWIKAVATSASECFGVIPTEIDAAEDVMIMINKATRYIHECYNECPFLELMRSRQDCLNDFEAIRLQIRDGEASPVASSSSMPASERYLLPPKACSPEHPQDETVDLELDLDTDTQREMEMVQVDGGDGSIDLAWTSGVHFERVKSLSEINFTDPKSKFTTFVIPLNMILEGKPELSQFSTLFKDIDFAVNMLQWVKEQNTLDQYQVFGLQRTPPSYIRFGFYAFSLGNTEPTLVHSENDTERSVNYEPNYYDINFGFRTKDAKLSDAQKLHVVKIKFFFGEVGYTKEERRILKRWIAEAGPELLRELFEKHILMGCPLKAERYRNSWLQKQLNQATFPTH